MNYLDKFSNRYEKDEIAESSLTFQVSSDFLKVKGVAELLNRFSGSSFNHGIYKIFSGNEFEKWDELVLGIFSQYKNKISCFARDWMGRIFAWDYDRNQIILLDPGFGEALKIPCDFEELHDIEFVDYADDSLAQNLFSQYINDFPSSIKNSDCVGYKISPFLGGIDNLDNMEIIDLEVYWSLCSDIYNQVNVE